MTKDTVLLSRNMGNRNSRTFPLFFNEKLEEVPEKTFFTAAEAEDLKYKLKAKRHWPMPMVKKRKNLKKKVYYTYCVSNIYTKPNHFLQEAKFLHIPDCGWFAKKEVRDREAKKYIERKIIETNARLCTTLADVCSLEKTLESI